MIHSYTLIQHHRDRFLKRSSMKQSLARNIRFVVPVFIPLLIIFISATTAYANHACPSCGMSMIWTGNTATEWGKILKEYQCPAGHEYWYPMSLGGSSGMKSMGPECPICGMSVIWTGETYTEWGRMMKVYRCPAGHISAGRF